MLPHFKMVEMDIVDKDGEWVTGAAPLGLRDPFTQVRFPFNLPVKVKLSDWVKNQMAESVIKPCADPLAEPPAPDLKVKAK